MTPLDKILTVFIVFLRIGSFMMIAPGFSSGRIPMVFRLYFSIAIAMSSYPQGDFDAFKISELYNPITFLKITLHELSIGGFLGFFCRLFITAIETLFTTYSYAIGLSNIFASGSSDAELSPVLTSFILLFCIQIMFIVNLHHIFILEIERSYGILSIQTEITYSFILRDLVNSLSQSYFLALRLSSPFVLFSVILNLSFAFMARLTPHTQAYFVSGPAIILLGLYFFQSLSSDFLSSFANAFQDFILRG